MRELRKRAQILDLLRGEAEIQQIFDRLRQSGRQNEIAIVRQAPDEQFEGGALAGLAGLEIARRHGELVEVGEKTAVCRHAITSVAVVSLPAAAFFDIACGAGADRPRAWRRVRYSRRLAFALRDEVPARRRDLHFLGALAVVRNHRDFDIGVVNPVSTNFVADRSRSLSINAWTLV